MREKWSSRSAFILAAIGSAVGLGNAWRFPGLAAKYGGGAFLFVYLIAMLVIGIPLLMMEISVARYTRQGAPGSMRALSKKAESIGWIAVSNGIGISIYYAAVFAWVILMFVMSFKFCGVIVHQRLSHICEVELHSAVIGYHQTAFPEQLFVAHIAC